MNTRGQKSKLQAMGKAPSGMLQAAALEYDGGEMNAPVVSAVGRKDVAKEMKKVARRYGVSVVQDALLVSELCLVGELGTVPPRLFEDVAKVLVKADRRK
jgi:type III secretion system FlhB-like substrate exporter